MDRNDKLMSTHEKHPLDQVTAGTEPLFLKAGLSLAFPASQAELETLKVIATFCGVGLVVSLLLATYGLDLSVGFF